VQHWNFADVFEQVAIAQPDTVAIRQGDRTVTYGELLARVDALGVSLRDRGASEQDKIGIYLYNSPEYAEAAMAALYARLVPVNTNYRYGDDELAYLWDNADCTAIVFHGTFTERLETLRKRCEKVTTWVHVDDGAGPCPPWAEPFESLAAPRAARTTFERSGDDLILLYTGGTTGMPKGVMWPQDDLFRRLNPGGVRRYDLDATLREAAELVAQGGPSATILPACPLMHGTGLFSSIECLAEGGTLVLLASRRFSGDELLDTIEATRTNIAVIVGDPFARPMLESLRARGDGASIASLMGMISSGAMFSEEVKEGLLEFNANMLLVDAFSSSEALGMGNSVVGASTRRATAEFTLGEGVRVIAEDGSDVVPGSDVAGRLALGGRLPLGYYKDDEKTAATFLMLEGTRYSVPGDWAKVRADGSIQLLGRGSQCINTAGEKVFPEEVEEVLKTHASVRDACVLGVPDERWGEVVMAVVEPSPATTPDEADLIAHVKERLASYKAPRRVRFVDTIARTPAGKMDYARHRSEMTAWLATNA
jgi:fatty-acyl-CoA synthase